MKNYNKISKIEDILPELEKIAGKCGLCPHRCGVNRSAGEKGICRAGKHAGVYSSFSHMGEEPPLSGDKGSGTIFFSQCNMACVYCQNNQFSQKDAGKELDAEALAEKMLELQENRCHNINLVSPTHHVLQIIRALRSAYIKGLRIPVIYNTGGYDSLEVIRLLDGIMDIYLPDMRYSNDDMARKYSRVPDYVCNNREIVKEMFRQAGTLTTSDGIAVKGLIVRLLILPGGISGTAETLEFISREIGRDVFLSVMSQYYPAYMAPRDEVLKNRISRAEYIRVADIMDRLGMKNGWLQPYFEEVDEHFAGENF